MTLGNEPLRWRERQPFVRLLNRGGYVLQFTNETFAAFTKEIVGFSIQDKYQLSKGKSLEKYLEEAPRSGSIRLLEALIDEWESLDSPFGVDMEEIELGKLCRNKLRELKDKLRGAGINDEAITASGFTSDYIEKQRSALYENIGENPTLAIGQAKEFVESCCITILKESAKEVSKQTDFPALFRKTLDQLGLHPKKVDPSVPEEATVSRMLANLAEVSNGLAQLRNSYGTGHGKSRDYRGLSEHHARLAVGTAIILVDYLWSSYQLRFQQKR